MQARRTGSSGLNGISGRPGSAEWISGVLFVLAFGLVLLAPVLALLGALEPIFRPAPLYGLVLFLAGVFGTLGAQPTMGDSWRIGVDEHEKTRLATRGPFAIVRNPIFTAMIPATLKRAP